MNKTFTKTKLNRVSYDIRGPILKEGVGVSKPRI